MVYLAMRLAQYKTTLDNGLRVVTETMPDVRSLAIGIVVEVGSGNEAAAENGTAHIIEHMLFKATRTRSAETLAHMIDMAGGQMGAFTTRDYTVLHAAVLDDYRTFALDIFGDMLLNARFDDDDVARELSVIAQEIAVGNEQPDKLALDSLKARAWPDHPLGRPIYGMADSISTISRAAVYNFYRKHYSADKIIVAAAGNVDHSDFVAQVQDALWAMPGRDSTPRAAGEAHDDNSTPIFQPGITLVQRPLNHVYFALGVAAPAYTAPERYNLFVLTTIIGGGISSRLYRTLRDETGWVYEVGAGYHPYRDGGMLVIEGVTAPDNVLPVVQTILAEMVALQTQPVEAEELWRAKEHLRGETLMGAESTNTRMSQLATQELYFGRFVGLPEVVAGIGTVTAAGVRAMAETLFPPGAFAFAAVGAFQDAVQTKADVAAILAIETIQNI